MTESMPDGYFGKILVLDLSEEKVIVRKLSPSHIENYLGGRGLATRLFYDEIDASCDPLSEDNVLVLAASPLVGTKAPTACRGHMVFKSPLTNIIGSSNCGGSWAYAFKSAGYDALIVKGKAPKPVLVNIIADEVNILPAEQFWGMNTHQTTDQLTESFENFKNPKILCIGPAGENLVRFSAIMNDKNRSYGRTGPGAVFGSKNLKAIRVYGNLKPGIKDSEKFQTGLEQARYLMKAAPITKRLLREMGTSGLVKLIDIIEMLPHNNFQDNIHDPEKLDKISGETIRKTILKRPGGCYGCPIGCQRHTQVREKKGEGPEYETVVMMGPQCGIYDLEEITRANYLCNELGLDTISFGGTVACAMELFENGCISPSEANGLELRFGNKMVLEELVNRVSFREGIGDRLAEGSRRLAEYYGKPEYSMTIKGLEIPAYDPRASYTQALGYITSPTGACHLRGGYAASLAFFGGNREIPRFSLLQSPIAIRNMQDLGIIQDSLGICRFTGFAFATEPWSRMVTGITGRDFSTARLEETANRVTALERAFNVQAGLTCEDDMLPDRFSRSGILVAGEKRIISAATIEKMKKDYYEIRGWTKEGIPPKV
jgi:aldehyde:ferredoxin oxidoreductase